MPATQPVAVTGTSLTSTEPGSQSDEPLVCDVTTEILGERREEWRDGFDSGVRAGTQRALSSNAMEQIVTELVLLREAAKKLGEKCDYWMRKSDEFEMEATYWHGLVGQVSSRPAVAAEKPEPKILRPAGSITGEL